MPPAVHSGIAPAQTGMAIVGVREADGPHRGGVNRAKNSSKQERQNRMAKSKYERAAGQEAGKRSDGGSSNSSFHVWSARMPGLRQITDRSAKAQPFLSNTSLDAPYGELAIGVGKGRTVSSEINSPSELRRVLLPATPRGPPFALTFQPGHPLLR
jgi:hypothetical protein